MVSGDFDEAVDGFFGGESDDAGAEFGVDVVVEGGDAEDSVCLCGFWVVVNVAFDDGDVGVGFVDFFEDGVEGFAWPAPFGPEVYEDGGGGIFDEGVEVIVCEVNHG